MSLFGHLGITGSVGGDVLPSHFLPQTGKDLGEQRPSPLYRYVGGWKASPYQAWAKGSWIQLKRKYSNAYCNTSSPAVSWQKFAFEKQYTNGQHHRVEGFPQSDKLGNKPSEVGYMR